MLEIICPYTTPVDDSTCVCIPSLTTNMHFSTTLLLSSVFSFSLALPAGFDPTDLGPLPKPGRLNISYSRTTYSQLSGSLGKSGPISKPFTIKAYSSFEPSVHLKDITASNGKFWVGNATGSYCPPTVADCPVGNVTVLQAIEGGVELVSEIMQKPMSQSLIMSRSLLFQKVKKLVSMKRLKWYLSTALIQCQSYPEEKNRPISSCRITRYLLLLNSLL